MKVKGVCRICGTIRIKYFEPEFMASGNICVNCYYKHIEPNNPYYGVNKNNSLPKE